MCVCVGGAWPLPKVIQALIRKPKNEEFGVRLCAKSKNFEISYILWCDLSNFPSFLINSMAISTIFDTDFIKFAVMQV